MWFTWYHVVHRQEGAHTVGKGFILQCTLVRKREHRYILELSSTKWIHQYLIVRQGMDNPNGTLRNGIVPMIHRLDNFGKMTQWWDLVSQLRLRTEETHCCCRQSFQSLSLEGEKQTNNYKTLTKASVSLATTW